MYSYFWMDGFSVTNLLFVRDTLTKKSVPMYKFMSVNVAKWTFLNIVSVPLYDLLSFLVQCCLCIWNQHCLGWNIFCTCSRFPEACVSERQTSRIFWTIRNSRFPEIRWTEQHPEFVPPFSPVHTWEYFVLSRLSRLLEECCPTDTPCRETRRHALAFTEKEKLVNFLRSFHRALEL